jgi:beta-phosphoglucomutase-like phosphatase (HAD superfamily)
MTSGILAHPCHQGQPATHPVPLRPVQAVIFDLDGVIVDSEPLHTQAWQELFELMGYGQNHGVDFAQYYGKSDRALALDFCARHTPPWPLEQMLAWKQDRLIELIRTQGRIYDGLPELICKLAPHYRLAIASGSAQPVIEAVLALRGLGRFFSARASSTEVPQGKPAPDVFLRAAQLLGVPARDCLVVEDAPAGVLGARAAGMQVIAITNSVPAEQLAQATCVVHTYQQIEELLLPLPHRSSQPSSRLGADPAALKSAHCTDSGVGPDR